MLTAIETLNHERLPRAAEAPALIPSRAKVAIALGVGQPPALLKATADRPEAGQVKDLRLLAYPAL
ncbi:hypothetical protein [Brevundimonas sp.]|jgi:itaconate CoA-transferase|uniref:hypothetical protein n=1 Tax=Brevundimonas sp. TaxID=1871086 RepID=UPI0037848B1D